MPHEFQIPARYVERAISREGRAHSVEELNGPSTALVTVDMQRYFMEQPFAGACSVAQEVVPNVNRLAAAVRLAGGSVVWLQMTAPAEHGDWSALRDRYTGSAAEARWGSLSPESRGYELWPHLDVRSDDVRIVKNRYSPFISGSSELDDVLRRRGINTLLVTGVATNVCCESTARDAMMLNYRVLMVSDGCAAATDAEHAAALGTFYLFFGDVQTTDELVALVAG
jgi:ureidoacrylate peracid hydrolase